MDTLSILLPVARHPRRAKGSRPARVPAHPRTPWARRAAWEKSIGFGMMFVDGFYDFTRYAAAANDVKLPTP